MVLETDRYMFKSTELIILLKIIPRYSICRGRQAVQQALESAPAFSGF